MFLGFLFLVFHLVIAETPVKDGDMELKMVQIIWRHGDRSPTATFPTDRIQESNWTFGGGGWGQLSPVGMKQHLKLGKMMRNRYVNTGNSTYNFLPEVYDQKAMYVRSTGINRTIVSAISNMLGMYGQPEYPSRANTDFADIDGWPTGFVPVPVHSVDYLTDYIGNMDSECPRRKWLWELAQQSDEMKMWRGSVNVTEVIDKIEDNLKLTVQLDQFWILADVLFIEQIYYNEDLRKNNPWFSDEFYRQIVAINDQIYFYQYGVFADTVMEKDVDVGLELLKSKSGPIVNEITDRIHHKSSCAYGNATGCTWIDNLKYYAYSAHDSTVYGVLVALGIETFAIPPAGYPLYSAALAIEYWRNTKNNSDYFRVMYHKNENDTINPLTGHIDGCTGEFCPISVLDRIATRLKTEIPIQEWCQTLGNDNSSSFNLPIFLVVLFSILKFA